MLEKSLDTDPKAIQQINFIENLVRQAGTTIFFIIKEAKETILDCSQGIVIVLWIYLTLIWYQYTMAKYNTLNLKLSNSQHGLKNGIEITLRLSSNIVGDSNDEKNFPH